MSDIVSNHAGKGVVSVYRSKPDNTLDDAGIVGGQIIEHLNLIHRANDAFITFTSKEGEDMPHKFAVRARELTGWIPQIVGHLLRDSFYTVNSMYRGARRESKYVKGLPAGERSNSMIRHLTCCFTDCDMEGTPQDQLIAALQTKRRAEELRGGRPLPDWSIMAHSGYGFWLFYLLREEGERDTYFKSQAAQADPFRELRQGIGQPILTDRGGKIVRSWRSCQQQLVRQYADVKADPKAIDEARVTRIPGTFNTKYGDQRRVSYRVNYNVHGEPVTHTLAEMCAMLDVEPPRISTQVAIKPRKTPSPEQSKAAKLKRLTMLRNRMSKLEQLAEIRGKYREGCRAYALLVFAITLRQMGVRDKAQLTVETGIWNRQYVFPPLTDKEVGYAVRSTMLRHPEKGHWMPRERVCNVTIADWLEITHDEARATGWPYAGFVPDPTLKGNRAAKRANRHTLIRQLIEAAGGELLTAAQIREQLEAQGVEITLRTIQLDLAEMQLAP